MKKVITYIKNLNIWGETDICYIKILLQWIHNSQKPNWLWLISFLQINNTGLGTIWHSRWSGSYSPPKKRSLLCEVNLAIITCQDKMAIILGNNHGMRNVIINWHQRFSWLKSRKTLCIDHEMSWLKAWGINRMIECSSSVILFLAEGVCLLGIQNTYKS